MKTEQYESNLVIKSPKQGQQWFNALVDAEGGAWMPDDEESKEEGKLLADALYRSGITASPEAAWQFWSAVSSIFSAVWLGFSKDHLDHTTLWHLDACASMIVDNEAFVDYASELKNAYLKGEGFFKAGAQPDSI